MGIPICIDANFLALFFEVSRLIHTEFQFPRINQNLIAGNISNRDKTTRSPLLQSGNSKIISPCRNYVPVFIRRVLRQAPSACIPVSQATVAPDTIYRTDRITRDHYAIRVISFIMRRETRFRPARFLSYRERDLSS